MSLKDFVIALLMAALTIVALHDLDRATRAPTQNGCLGIPYTTPSK